MSRPSLASRLLRFVLRRAYPEYELQQDQLKHAVRLLKQLDARVRDSATRHEAQVRAVASAVDTLPTREDVQGVARELHETKKLLIRHSRATARLLQRGGARSEQSREERRVLRRLERIAASQRPIVVGPWSGEVGFELLYWVPFVRWFTERYDVDPSRMVILSRGGTSSWYSGVGQRYVDALSYVSPDEFRAATEQVKKQRGLTRLDAQLLRRVVPAERLGRVHLLHPQAMYQVFWQFWKENVSVRRVEQYTSYAPVGPGAPADLPPALPRDYVAMRFYFSACFPDTPANRAFVSETITAVSRVTDVVLLNTPFRVDDHEDYAVAGGPRVHVVADMPPARNLAIQTAVIRGARAFVGTYGGYAYLAPMCGVPSIAFYSVREFFQHHLDLAQRVVTGMGKASLVVLDTRDADLLRSTLQGGDVTSPSRTLA